MFTDVLRKSQLLWNYSCPFYEDKFIYSWRQKITLLGFDDSHNFLSNYKIKEQDYPNGGWRIFTEDANWFWKVLQKRSQSSKNNSKDLHKLFNHRSSDASWTVFARFCIRVYLSRAPLEIEKDLKFLPIWQLWAIMFYLVKFMQLCPFKRYIATFINFHCITRSALVK